MTTCEHGQNFTYFCVSQRCAWKDVGGCQACVKKYHNHIGPTSFLLENDINQLIKKFAVDHHIKPKCRSLQQAIFNYFNLIKTQINNSLDSICKAIVNQIGYPFLSSNGQLSTYKRLKNKEYKKINQKDLKTFYDTTIKINQTDFLKQQSKIYFSEIEKATVSIQDVDILVKNILQLASKGSNNLQTDNSFLKKVNQIIKIIIASKNSQSPTQIKKDLQVSKKQIKKNYQNKEIKILKTQQIHNQRSLLTPKPINDRMVSIDKTFKKTKPQKQKQKEKEKQKEKQKQKQKVIKVQAKKQKEDKSAKGSYLKNQNEIKQQQQKIIEMIKSKQFKSNQKIKPFLQSPQKIQTIEKSANNSVTEKSSNSNSLDCDNINNPDYDHTNIPRQKSHKKIFQDTQDVIKRTFIVPVNQTQNLQKNQNQIYSPILKVKRLRATQSIKQKNNLLEQIKSTSRSESTSPLKQVIKENQEKSLNFLVKSLGMKAEEAIPHLQSALKYAENNLSAAQYLSFLLLQIGRPKQCLNLCNKYLEKLQNSTQYDELSVNLNNNKTAALNMLGRYSESIVILQKTLAHKQKDTLYKNLADAFFSIGIYQKAIYNYQKAISLFQNYDEAYYNLAVCLYSQQNYYNAKMAVTRALDVAPKNIAYLQLLNHINQRVQIV